MKLRQLWVLSMVSLALAGCQTMHGKHEGPWRTEPERPATHPLPGTPAPAAEIPAPVPAAPSAPLPVESQPAPLPEVRALPNFPKAAEEISGGAVVALLRQAREARAAGHPDQAAAALERALRIEPRNYFVWSALAGTYLQQKNYEQAESVAHKSNSLARGNVYVELENWRVIRDARNARRDAAGASQAQARMDAIQQLLQPAPPQ